MVVLYPGEETAIVGMLELPYSKQVSAAILVVSLLCVVIDFGVLLSIYRRRSLRSTCTAIIVCNLACVDILVTLKDIPKFLDVIDSNRWRFVDDWCQSYGLTSVIFIIVSVSTLVTISSERYSRLRHSAMISGGPPAGNGTTNGFADQNPLVLGYVIAHTTLSYSLSLLYSKYIFVARKAACKVEWPPHNGFSITFLASFVFIVPVSALVYNVLIKSEAATQQSSTSSSLLEKTKSEISDMFEERAQQQIHVAVTIFLCSWTPYVLESLISSYYMIPANLGILVACLPMFSTSLLPLFYISYTYPVRSVPVIPTKVVVQ